MQQPWDSRKNAINKRKHGISLELALLVFDDPNAVTAEDYLDDNGEMRYQTLGLVEDLLIFVAHVYREMAGQETPWLISARKAVKNEEEIYWSNQRQA